MPKTAMLAVLQNPQLMYFLVELLSPGRWQLAIEIRPDFTSPGIQMVA